MKRLSGRSTEVEWPEQTALCAFSKHTVADGLFVEQRTGCIARLYAAR